MGDARSSGGVLGLAASGLPRLVELPGGRTIEVRPPFVREAVEILEALEGAVRGEEGDVELVDDVLGEWLPLEVLQYLATLKLAARDRILRGLLFGGVDLEAAKRRRKKKTEGEDAEQEKRPTSWRVMLSDYCQVWGGEPWTVYTTVPFPFFVAMLAEADRAAARDILRWAELEILPHTGKAAEKILGRLKRRAEPERPEDEVGSYAPPEVIARERAKLKARMGGPKAQKPPGAP